MKIAKHYKIWKIVAGIVIIIFLVFVILGTIKVFHFKNSFTKATEEQRSLAREIATARLNEIGVDSSKLKVDIPDKMRKRDESGPDTLPVMFYNDTITHTYLIDVDSGEVLMHTTTEFFGKMPAKPRMERPQTVRFPKR